MCEKCAKTAFCVSLKCTIAISSTPRVIGDPKSSRKHITNALSGINSENLQTFEHGHGRVLVALVCTWNSHEGNWRGREDDDCHFEYVNSIAPMSWPAVVFVMMQAIFFCCVQTNQDLII
jgi:hypothetical protein